MIAQAGWRNTNRTLSLAALDERRRRARGGRRPSSTSKGSAGRVHHVQVATNDLLNRLKAIDVGVQAGCWTYNGGSGTAAGSPFRMIVDNGIKAAIHMDGVHIAPLNALVRALLRHHRRQLAGQPDQRRPVDHPPGGAPPLHARERLVPEHGGQDRLDRNRQARRPRRPRPGLFTCTDEELKRIKPVLTVVDGKIVHDAGVLRT